MKKANAKPDSPDANGPGNRSGKSSTNQVSGNPQAAPSSLARSAQRSPSNIVPASASERPASPKPSATMLRNPEKQHSYYLECNQVAPPFAIRRTDPVRDADAALVSAISEPSNVLQTIHPERRTWQSLRDQLTRSLFRPRGRADAAREDELVVRRSNWFVTFGQHKDMPGRVREWFDKTVGDADLVAARAEVDLSSIAAVASHAGRLTAASLLFKKESKEKQLVDVGVIRYPDPKHPYVKAYRIELTARYESTIIFGCTFDTNVVRAKINLEEFEPPGGTLAPSRRATDNSFAVAQADALFA